MAKRISILSAAVLLIALLSACGFMRGRPQDDGIRGNDSQDVVTSTPVVIEPTKRPVTATDIEVAPGSPTNIKELGDGIPFNYVFRGFFLTTPEKLTEIINSPDSYTLIQDEEGWQDYQAKYCPGIEWSGEYYYPEYQYFAMITTGAKPKYAVSLNIDRVTFSESEIEVSTKLEPIEAQIQAYSDLDGAGEGHAQYFVCIIALKSSDIPEAVAENMKYVY